MAGKTGPKSPGRRETDDKVRRLQRVLCGAATATALGISPEIELQRFSAAAALDALRNRISRGQRVLVPRAAEGRDELLDGLVASGVILEAPVAYRTVAVDAAARRLRSGGIDVVTLCSPSAARALSLTTTFLSTSFATMSMSKGPGCRSASASNEVTKSS